MLVNPADARTYLRLGDGRFTFHGCGDLTGKATEGAAVASVAADMAMVAQGDQGRPALHDPLQRAARPFAAKRAERMPWRFDSSAAYLREVKAAYDPDSAGGEVSRLLDTVEALGPGPVWREVRWPWSAE